MSRVGRSFWWSATERFSAQGISFILSTIIARMVAPSSYGLIVMVQTFLTLSQSLIEGGFSNALIQKKDSDDIDFCTVYIFNIVTAVCIYLLLFFLAPIIASVYDEIRLISIIRIISINLIISSFSIVQRTRLIIELDFKTQTKASILAVIISGTVGMICAYYGLETWALVIQSLINQLITTVALLFFSRWKPKLIFSVQSFKNLFNFGSKLMINNILTSIYLNTTNLVIGKKYSPTDLAFYNRGFSLSQFASTNISDVMNRVIYPVLVKVQDDMDSLKKEYLKYLHLSYYIVLPMMAGGFVLAKPLIEVFLTSTWLQTVPYFQLFCLNFMFYPLQLQTGNPIIAIGKSGVILNAQIVKRTFSLVTLIITLTIGVSAVCWGILISSAFEAFVNILICRKEIGIGFGIHIKTLSDIILSVAIMCFLVFFVTAYVSSPILKLIIGTTSGAIFYLLGTWLFNIYEKEYLVMIINKIKQHIKNKYN